MIDALHGACAVLDIDQRGGGPDLPSLIDELVVLIDRSAADTGIDASSVSGAPDGRLIVAFPGRPSGATRLDAFVDRLATALSDRNAGLDLCERLRIRSSFDEAPAAADRLASSPLLPAVLAATPTSSLVVGVSEAWFAATRPAVDYRHVQSGGNRFWVRVPGRSTVPGLAPVDLLVGGQPGGAEARTRNRRTTVVISTPPRAPDRAGGTQLDGRQAEQLRLALTDAYPSFDELAQLLREMLHQRRNLHEIASAHLRLGLVVGQLIHRAETEGWIRELVTAAFLGNPGNPTLRRLIETGFCDEAFALMVAVKDPTGPIGHLWPQATILADLVADGTGGPEEPWSGSTLERIFRTRGAFQDVWPFVSRLLAVAGQVCQVRIGSGAVGTGFLVGPDLVLTNHHVVEEVIDGRVAAAHLRCVFDHRVDDDGSVHDGVPFGVPADGGWLVAASPPSEVDDQERPTRRPTTGELDYALIRLAEPAGRTTGPNGRERGWLRPLEPAPPLEPGLPLLIVQHPDGRPVMLAMADDGVGAVNENRTRVAYRVNTEAGSSGSPCLTFGLELVALHHSGRELHNEGIPIATIVAHLDPEAREALRRNP